MLASSSGLIGVFSSSLSLRAQQNSPANSRAGRLANCANKLTSQIVNGEPAFANESQPRRRGDPDPRQLSASGRIRAGHKNVTALARGQLDHGETVTRPPTSSSSSRQLSSGTEAAAAHTAAHTEATRPNSSSESRGNQQVQRLTKMFSHWRTRRDAPELPRWPGASVAVISERLGAAHEIQPIRRLDLERNQTRRPSRLEARLSPAAALVARHLAQNAQTPSSGGLAQTHVALSMTQNHTAHIGATHHNHHHVEVNESDGTDPNGLACVNRGGDDDDPDLKSQRPWHSLVLPVVLACVIFLVALWTRQISLAVTNDKILMIMILIGLFIVMSGLALWLSCDQYLDEESDARNSETTGRQIHDGTAQVHCHCHHHHRHFNGGNNSNSQQLANRCHHTNQQQQHQEGNSAMSVGAPDGRRCYKCCAGISLIDCQPPDYYSAVKNSMPIQHYLVLEHENKRRLGKNPNKNHNDDEDDDDNDRGATRGEPGDTRLYLSPPSYEELQKRSSR